MSYVEKIVFSIVLTLLILIIFLVCFFVRRFITNKVKKSSKVLSELEIINGKTKYKDIKYSDCFSYDCISRAEYNHFILCLKF